MNAVDKNLLMRIARRLEGQAEDDYRRVPVGADAKVYENARRKRDRELGDALDLRTYVKKMDVAAAEVPEPIAP